MRLHVANPNSDAGMTRTIAAAAEAIAAPGTSIIATRSRTGPASIEGYHDGALAVSDLLARVADTSADAHIVACFDDTGLDAARCATSVPVVGIGEAACLIATQLAERYVVVTSAAVSILVIEANLRRSGLATRCAGVRAAGVPVLDIAQGAGGPDDPVAAAVRRAAAEIPGAAIVLGCAGMADLAGALTKELDRPVVDGVAAAVTIAEGVVRLGLRTVKGGGYGARSSRQTLG